VYLLISKQYINISPFVGFILWNDFQLIWRLVYANRLFSVCRGSYCKIWSETDVKRCQGLFEDRGAHSIRKPRLTHNPERQNDNLRQLSCWKPVSIRSF